MIEAAARHPAGLAAIVSLSGERELPSYPDILQLAGIAHGTELLDQSGPDGTSVRDHILAFIRAQLRPG